LTRFTLYVFILTNNQKTNS